MNFDFTLPSSGLSNPLLAKITFQYEAIKDILAMSKVHYEKVSKELKEYIEKEIRKIDNENKGEIPEILQHIKEPIYNYYDDEQRRLFESEQALIHSTFLLTYAYFESIVTAICTVKKIEAENHVANKVKKILDNYNGAKFTPETQDTYNYLVGDLKDVRNLLTHNYNGSNKKNQLEAAERESKKDIGFNIYRQDYSSIKYKSVNQAQITEELEEEYSFSIKYEYVNQALEKEYEVLQELLKIIES